VKILGISGSLRRGSYNRSLLGARPPACSATTWSSSSNPLRNKPVAVVGASIGAFGAVWSQAELRKVLAATGARVVEGEVAVGHAPTRFDGNGRLVDENLLEQLEEVVAGLLVAAARCAAMDSPLGSRGMPT
jgi:chromate reductase, NAD(P)H dehydrogenase (quinone)